MLDCKFETYRAICARRLSSRLKKSISKFTIFNLRTTMSRYDELQAFALSHVLITKIFFLAAFIIVLFSISMCSKHT